MKLMKSMADVVQYLSDAIARIFGPNRDDYPATGVQPFTGDSDNEDLRRR